MNAFIQGLADKYGASYQPNDEIRYREFEQAVARYVEMQQSGDWSRYTSGVASPAEFEAYKASLERSYQERGHGAREQKAESGLQGAATYASVADYVASQQPSIATPVTTPIVQQAAVAAVLAESGIGNVYQVAPATDARISGVATGNSNVPSMPGRAPAEYRAPDSGAFPITTMQSSLFGGGFDVMTLAIVGGMVLAGYYLLKKGVR